MEPTLKPEDVIIVGGGPAGMICAVQLKRYGIVPRLFEANRLGGLLWNANLVENYAGFPGGIPGPELVKRFTSQLESHALEVTPEQVNSLDFDGEQFLVTTQAGQYTSRVVVAATGTRPRPFVAGFIPPQALSKVFYEVAPLLDVKHKKIAIIGAGDAAFDYGINLSRHNQVLILNRTREIKALPLLVQRCAKIQDIEYLQDTPVLRISMQDGGLLLETANPNKQHIQADLLIGAIGRVANLPEMSARLQSETAHLAEAGALHVVGDVKNGIYRQTAIAVGDGLKAAMKIYQFLKE